MENAIGHGQPQTPNFESHGTVYILAERKQKFKSTMKCIICTYDRREKKHKRMTMTKEKSRV